MKATYNPQSKAKFTTSHRKDRSKCFLTVYKVISLDAMPQADGSLHAPVEARCYGTGNQNTCCLWITQSGREKNKCPKCGQETVCSTCPQCAVPAARWGWFEDLYVSGSGKAGGYGYHRPSAAMGEAITNAGFTLDQDIHGVGDTAMREAMLALAHAIGVTRPALVESYA